MKNYIKQKLNRIWLLPKSVEKRPLLVSLFVYLLVVRNREYYREMLNMFLLNYKVIVKYSFYDFFLDISVYVIGGVVSLLVLRPLLDYIFKLFKKDVFKPKLVAPTKITFFALSHEDLKQWCIDNGVYDKVPSNLWEEYDTALEKCRLKNTYSKLTLTLINKRHDDFISFSLIQAKILKILKK